MELVRVSNSTPVNYSNKSRQVVAKPQSNECTPTLNVKQESYHYAYSKLEKLKSTDLSLYEEVEQYPESSSLKEMFSLSIHV